MYSDSKPVPIPEMFVVSPIKSLPRLITDTRPCCSGNTLDIFDSDETFILVPPNPTL